MSTRNKVASSQAVLPNKDLIDLQSQNQFRGFKNHIINGGMQVWQRGTSGLATGIDIYFSDTWIGRCVNTAYTSQGALQVKKGINDSAILMTPNGIAISDYSRFYFRTLLELSKNLIGKTVTLSFSMKAILAITEGEVEALYRADSKQAEDGVRVQLGNSTDLSTSEYKRYSMTFVVPSFTNYLTVGVGLRVQPLTTPDVEVVEVTDIQLEEGPVATEFERRPYGLELSLCQRYLYVFTPTNTVSRACLGIAALSTRAEFLLPLPVEMRVTPTIILSSISNWILSNTQVGTPITSITSVPSLSSRSAVGFYANTAGGLTILAPYFFERSGGIPASNPLIISAEL